MNRLAKHHPGLVEAGNCLLNSDKVGPTLGVQERALLGLDNLDVLNQLGNQFTQTAYAGLDDTQLHSIALRGKWDEGKR